MRLIPNIAYNNDSHAEQKLFSALKAVEVAHNCVAFHSVIIPNHAYKRVSEADFVIVGNFGVFVLEVKGGRVSHKDGQWYTNDNTKISDPFKQASSALHALNEKILTYVDIERERIPIGYGVVSPDVTWTENSVEWASEIVCDSIKIRYFDYWLESFFKYWHSRPANAVLLSDDDVNKIIDFLRPDFEFVQPLFAHVDNIKESSVKLTEEQYHYVDMAMENKRVICSGGAGTGKTFLAAELCRRFIAQDKTVLLACHSSWLRHYLITLIPSEKLIVTTISGLSSTMRREGIDSFEVVIVDEGQDILNIGDLEILDSVLQGGWNDGQWYFFHDSNNQANILTELDKNALSWLKSKNYPAIFKLNINCRNTKNILLKIQTSLACDVGKPALTEGPEVTEFIGNGDVLSKQLSTLLKELRASELDKGSITILSALRRRKSILSLLPKDEVQDIVELDDYKVKSYPFNNITFAEIANFKGLENDVIILLDLEQPEYLLDGVNKHSLHYVGMSRARAKLYCFWQNYK
jgi:hypothetical protein